MRFSSTSIKGSGLGSIIGFPTINLLIPETFNLRQGVHKCMVVIQKQEFQGALYYGPKTIPRTGSRFATIVEKMGLTLEVHLLLFGMRDVLPTIHDEEEINVTIDKFIRKPKKISTLNELSKIIQNDVELLTEKHRIKC